MLLGRSKSIAVFLVGFATTLYGCGGGSDPVATGSVASLPVTIFPVDSVVTELATTGGRFDGTYTGSTGVRETLSINYTQVSPGQFTRQETLIQNGATLRSEKSTINFLNSPFRITGWTDQALNPVAISQGAPLPVSANIGDGAVIMYGTQYIQNNGLSDADIGLTHRVTLAWTLAAHSASTADLCISQTIGADFINTKKLDCFEIDASGKILSFKGVIQIHSKSIDQEVIYQ